MTVVEDTPRHPLAYKTPQRVAEATAMYERGLVLREVAEHFGVNYRTIHQWIRDPDNSVGRERARKYSPPCVDCGNPTAGKRKGAQRCRPCRNIFVSRERWTEETIIAALRAWAEKHDRTPSPKDWNTSGDKHPCTSTVMNACGSWSAAIKASGLPPLKRGRCGAS